MLEVEASGDAAGLYIEHLRSGVMLAHILSLEKPSFQVQAILFPSLKIHVLARQESSVGEVEP